MPRRRDAPEVRSADGAAGLDRIREILVGDILVELERRLARLDSYIANRSNELAQVVRHRTGVLEAHVRKELEALAGKEAHDSAELTESIRSARHDQRDVMEKMEQRIARLEDRLEGSIARVEREMREQLLAQANSYLEELERVRVELRAVFARELDIEPEALQEDEHAGALPASH